MLPPDFTRTLGSGAPGVSMSLPYVVSFSPIHHFTEHNIRIHTSTCVLALQVAHLMRREAENAGAHLSVRALLEQLAGIGKP